MKSTITKISLLLLLIASQFIIAQGPWAKGKGHGYGQLLFNVIPTYDQLFDTSADGNMRQTERKLSDFTIAPYIEFGVSDKLTFGGSIPFNMVSSGEASDENVIPIYPEDNLASFGNINVFGKYTFIDKKWKVAFISDFSLPTSTRNEESGLSTGVDAFTFQPKLSLGSSEGKFYYYGYFGYGLRSNDYHDFLHFGVEAGYKATEKVTIMLHLNRLHNLGNGNSNVDTPANLATGFYTSTQEYGAFLLKVFAEKLYKDLGGFLSLGGGGFGGNSVAVSPAISLGVFYKW